MGLLSLPNLGNSTKKATFTVMHKGFKETIDCMFNPPQISLNKDNDYTTMANKGSDTEDIEYRGGIGERITMELLFDTTMATTGFGSKDVRDRFRGLWHACYIDTSTKDQKTQLSDPPTVLFAWGKLKYEGFITNIDARFVFFDTDGTPLRAEVSITMKQKTANGFFPKQNPTSGAIPGKIHLVREGDRLDLIAAEHYDKPMMWRYIAEENGIDNPRQLAVGTRLVIPPAP